MSEEDAETAEIATAAPEEAAPAVEDEQQPGACADLAQVTETLGTQTPPLKDPETSALTGSLTTDSGYAEAVSRPETEEGEDQRALRTASLRTLSPSPEFQSVGSTPSPERIVRADSQPEFGAEMAGTSSPAGDDHVYATPAATPPPAQEGEEGPRTPTRTLSPVDEPHLRVSPKRKIENMDLDVDSGTDLPALQKKARAGSGGSDVDTAEHQWDVIPPPRDIDRRLSSRLPWGNEVLMLGQPISNLGSAENLSGGNGTEGSGCATGSRDQSWEGAMEEGACAGETDSLYSATSDLTQVMTSASPSQSQPAMLGVRPKSSCSVDSRQSDFRSPPREPATEPYRTCAGRMMLYNEDWTHYAQQDEVRPGDLHLEWPENMRTVGPRRIPAGAEGTFRQEYSKPHAPTFHGRILRRKHGVKVPRSWGNAGERPTIRRTMEEGAIALENNRDWVAPLMECHSDPEEGHLHTVLATGEVLPFSLALAVAYEYPCTLGQQQPDLHERLVYSSIYGIPLIVPAEAQGIRIEHRRDRAQRAAAHGGR